MGSHFFFLWLIKRGLSSLMFVHLVWVFNDHEEEFSKEILDLRIDVELLQRIMLLYFDRAYFFLFDSDVKLNNIAWCAVFFLCIGKWHLKSTLISFSFWTRKDDINIKELSEDIWENWIEEKIETFIIFHDQLDH